MSAVKAKHKKYKPKPITTEKDRGWMVAGFDTSVSCLAGAAIGYDRVLNRYVGPVFTITRWQKEMDYLERLRQAASSFDLVLDMKHQLKLITVDQPSVFIAQEEPWPLGMAAGSMSSFLKQQAEMSGAFLAGTLRYGYTNVLQMNSIRWRTMIADDLGITTHHTKWRDPELCKKFNCTPKDSGKFRSKQWALGYAPFSEYFKAEVPDLPDIIESTKLGRTPRPEGSKAKAIQPADEYDALAVCWTLYLELKASKLLPTGRR